MNILSMFDGIACGRVALNRVGIPVNKYVAYEIEEDAIKVAKDNFPDIEEKGDVFAAQYKEGEFDLLIGGSPCTYWSIAKAGNKGDKGIREITASGLGWELFQQYVRALKEAEPKAFIYENNKSMSAAIRESISDAFGFEPVCINSALVSAQNRQRLYWVGIRQSDGTYRKVNVEQPADLGIVLTDVLDTNSETRLEKARTIDATYYKATNGSNAFNGHQSGTRLMVAEPIKALTEKEMDYMVRDHLEHRWAHCNKPGQDNKSKCVVANLHKGVPYNVVAEPVNALENGKSRTSIAQYDKQSISNVIGSAGFGTTGVAEPINTLNDEGEKARTLMAGYYKYGMATMITNDGFKGGTTAVAESVSEPSEKSIPIYEVKDGHIIVKGKEYPIKLADGFYFIRKLTVSECMRLQTVPEWYEFPVSNSQAYKMLGNGWTISVIRCLLKAIMEEGIN